MPEKHFCIWLIKMCAAVQVNEKNERTALKPQPKTWCKSDSLNSGHRFSHHHRFCCVGSVCGVRQKLCCWCDVGGICFRRLNSFRRALFSPFGFRSTFVFVGNKSHIYSMHPATVLIVSAIFFVFVSSIRYLAFIWTNVCCMSKHI